VLALAGSVAAQVTQRLSIGPGDVDGDGPSDACSISLDGRYVAFDSGASNLVAGDANGRRDVFVRDLQLGTLVRASVATGGQEGDDDSLAPSISADGRWVAFQSAAANLVPGDLNMTCDVFVRDLATGTTTRITVGPGGVEGNDESLEPSITPDGRFVAFHSAASNLAVGDTVASMDVFVHDRALGTTELVSRSSQGVVADADSLEASISADGRFVAFHSLANNLVANDTNGWSDVFVRDRLTGLTTRVSVSTAGLEGESASLSPSLSADGRFVAFMSYSANLVPQDTNDVFDVFVHDRATGTTARVSVATGGAQCEHGGERPALSADGRHVVFLSLSAAPGSDTSLRWNAFLHDRASGATDRISVATDGTGSDDDAAVGAASADGRYVVFASDASSLVVSDKNRVRDVFVRDRGARIEAFCAGDGLGPLPVTPCPCGNVGAPGHGCANSVRAEGAVLATTGSPYADDLRLVASGMPATAPCTFFQGDMPDDVPFGDGVRCTGGSLVRLRTVACVAGASAFPDELHPHALSLRSGVTPYGGARRFYQAYYPNVAPLFCPPERFNATNGLIVDW
jgi:Tol biopolymer transport system component